MFDIVTNYIASSTETAYVFGIVSVDITDGESNIITDYHYQDYQLNLMVTSIDSD